MIKTEIKNSVENILKDIGYDVDGKVILEIPQNKSFGDYSTNVCFSLAPTLRMSPKQIAEKICNEIEKNEKFSGLMTFSAVNGFINLKLSNSFLWSKFETMFEGSPEYPKSDKKILLEYVSANPTGPLHIGHGRWAVLGSVLDTIIRFVQIPVLSEFYINDAGNQIKNLYKSVEAVKNGQPIPEDGYHGAYVHDLAKLDRDPLLQNIDNQKQTLQKLGVVFDEWFSEKSLYALGEVEKILKLFEVKGLSFEQDGAVWFKSSAFGDEKDRVLVKTDGSFTYFLVDVAYHCNKINRGFNSLINIWGADHHGYVPRMKAAVSALCGEEYLEDSGFRVLIGQLVSLRRNGEPVKMSKRTGDMITLDEVMEEIGVDATRFFLIQKSQDTHLEFDLDLAKKKSAENPVYYIQYAHARICSILRKLEIKEEKVETLNIESLEEKERKVIFHCLQVYDEVFMAANNFIPYKLALYTLALAKCFHLFYESCPIIKADEETRKKRVAILFQIKATLALCLKLMGISAPERM
jgi:arginyl-tRNA synthetase